MANYVYRLTKVGSWVMINARWYYIHFHCKSVFYFYLLSVRAW